MVAPVVKIMVGVNLADGVGCIMPINVHADMGNHGKLTTPVTINRGDLTFKLSYVSPKGNLIYREIKDNE